MTYIQRHKREWHGKAVAPPQAPSWSLAPLKEGARAMLIISADGAYAEPGKHPVIGSSLDHCMVLGAAKEATSVIMGYGTLAASRHGIPCKRLYVATRNPASIDYSLPVFYKERELVLVTPSGADSGLSPVWHSVQSYLPPEALVLGGPALLEEYYKARLLRSIDLTVSPYLWPKGLRWEPTFPMFTASQAVVESTGELLVKLGMLYAQK